MEMLGAEGRTHPHLPIHYDFRDGKMWPNQRVGFGVEFDPSEANLVLEVTEQFRPIPLFSRPDGSITNW